MIKVDSHPVRLGLALSGGGVSGLAHIGVLQAFEAAGIRPDCLSGASMGGVIAAAYAAGHTPAEITNIALETFETRQLLHLADLTLPTASLFRGENLLELFEQILQGRMFADLDIPLTLIAADLNSDREIRMQEGPVAEAMRATVSIPGLLPPVEQDGMRLVDGALLNNVPADAVREMGAGIVVAVDVYQRSGSIWQELSRAHLLPGIISELVITLGDSLDTMIRQLQRMKLQLSPPDFLIQPEIPERVTVLTGFKRVEELVACGEEAARAVIPELLEKLQASG